MNLVSNRSITLADVFTVPSNNASMTGTFLHKPTGVFDNFATHFLCYSEYMVCEILMSCQHAFEYDVEKITIGFLQELRNDIIGISSKTLVTVMHNEKHNGQLEGLTSEKRYESFDRKLKETSYLKEIFMIFPVLESLILSKLTSRLKQFEEIIMRLDQDHMDLVSCFNIDEHEISHIRFSEGDSHNEGKTVSIIEMSEGSRFVYKPPHNMQIEHIYHKLIEWLNGTLIDEYPLTSTPTLNGNDYGWQAFVKHLPCCNLREVKSYYYKIGKILALLYCVGAKDIHSENIIACGENPIIIDLETLFSNDNPVNLNKHISIDFLKHMNKSVFGTMLLPQKVVNAIIDVDLSGISGGAGVKSEKVKCSFLKLPGTDKMCFESDYIATQDKQNKVILEGGEEVCVTAFAHLIERGFETAIATIMKEKSAFIKLLSSFYEEDLKYRQVIRPTHVYAKYLEASLHPKYMTSSEERNSLFEMLYSGYQQDNIQIKRIEREIKALMRHDIPYFCADFSTKSLWEKKISQ